MVILESLGAGLPVVATAVGGVPDVVRAGQDRWLVPPEDAGALSTAMEEALADRTKRERRGAAGQARVRDEFDVEPWAAGHLQLYSEAINRHASPDRGAET